MTQNQATGRPFLGVVFSSCAVYGRLYKNKAGDAYVGTCPKCGKPVRVAIGSGGTSERFFEVLCR